MFFPSTQGLFPSVSLLAGIQEGSEGGPSGAAANKRRTLQDLFRPPIDLLHKGTFQSVSGNVFSLLSAFRSLAQIKQNKFVTIQTKLSFIFLLHFAFRLISLAIFYTF